MERASKKLMTISAGTSQIQTLRNNLGRVLWGVLFGIGVLVAPVSHADYVPGDLQNFISDLYGGEGIFLSPAPGIPAFIADRHTPHFTGTQQIRELNALSNGILSGTGVFALNSTASAIAFDLSAGAPVAVENSLGPLLAERANTGGKGRFSIGFGYSQQEFEELDGKSLNNIQVLLSHQDCCAVGPPPIPPGDGQLTGVELDTILLNVDINLEQEVYAVFANYGLADNWDIGIVVPIVSVEATAFSTASVVLSGAGSLIGGNPIHSFAANDPDRFSNTGGDETGLGDIVVRTKYNFMSDGEGSIDLAFLGQVTLPTGDEEDLLGTGETKYKGMFIASKSFGRVTPHVNLAWEQASEGSQFENISYAVGFDARLSDRFTGAIDVIGRHSPNIDEIGSNPIDIAFAAKFNPFSRANAPINFFVSFPLNDDGLRSDFIWGIGI
ncbi:MAG: hypothetical protein ACI9ON_003360, partial [Limisphaerales bacterium]